MMLSRTHQYSQRAVARHVTISTARMSLCPHIVPRPLLFSGSTIVHNHHRSYHHSPSACATSTNKTDRLLIVGSGVAGSAAALIAAEVYKIPVTVLFAGAVPTDCNSHWAQGGIIYRNYDASSNDSAALLAHDIHRAGAGLCDDAAVQTVARDGPERVRQLLLNGSGISSNNNNTSGSHNNNNNAFANVPFDRDVNNTNEWSLCLEASHQAPRILHTADHTGATITKHITEAAARHPLITLQPHTIVTDLVMVNNNDSDALCVGVETMDARTSTGTATTTTAPSVRNNNITSTEYASYGTLLAAGGLAGIYEHSTNPTGFNALGSSVALAVRANLLTQDLEYVQFHPTALCVPGQPRFLLTEALRGEGAILRDRHGRAFAKDYHPDGELAPRDVVARAVFTESQKTTAISQHQHNAFLDIRHRDADWLHARFPTICNHLQTQQTGLDLAHDLLPVTPAAHYTCGGIATDLNGRVYMAKASPQVSSTGTSGRTAVAGVYAAGEAARTGLHGANRLASTSLLEGLVFGAAVADHVAATTSSNISSSVLRDAQTAILALQQQRKGDVVTPTTTPSALETSSEASRTILAQTRQVMWNHVGVTRTKAGLASAQTALAELRDQAEHWHALYPTIETAAVRDAATAGHAVAAAALANPVSAGAHCLVNNNENDDNILPSDRTTEARLAPNRDYEDDEVMAMAR